VEEKEKIAKGETNSTIWKDLYARHMRSMCMWSL
jgi:hypothetical protein